MQSKILVVGSINMDLVVGVVHLPAKGETILGDTLKYIPGGKGANQSVAAARLGGDVSFIGKVGSDSFGNELIGFLEDEKLEIKGVTKSQGSSGVALITVDKGGENTIVVVPGSNGEISEEYITEHEELIKKSVIVLAQFEIPLQTVDTLFRTAKKYNKQTILNPAPALPTPDSILQNVDYFILNEVELGFFAGEKKDLNDKEALIAAAKLLVKRGPKVIIVTLGAQGAMAITQDQIITIDGIRVKAVDTTSAGDCFVGAFAAQISNGMTLEAALAFANKAAAISVQRWGASSSIPYLSELNS